MEQIGVWFIAFTIGLSVVAGVAIRYMDKQLSKMRQAQTRKEQASLVELLLRLSQALKAKR